MPRDAEVLSQIARHSKAHWGYPDTWLDIWHDALTITPEFIEANFVSLAEVEGDEAGFFSLIEEDAGWELAHFFVLPKYIGQGIGRELWQEALRRLDNIAPGEPLSIESDPNAEGFYLRMGARRVGELTTEWDGLQRTLPFLLYEPVG
jgi:GNAT superfamily N-acetyltransferase